MRDAICKNQKRESTLLWGTRCPQKFHSIVIRDFPHYSARNLRYQKPQWWVFAHGTWAWSIGRSLVVVPGVFVPKSIVPVQRTTPSRVTQLRSPPLSLRRSNTRVRMYIHGTCTEWKQCKEAWIHSVNVWVIDRSGDCRVWKGQDRGCQSSPGHGSGRRIFCDPFRSYRSAIFYSSRVPWFGFLWFDTETYSFGTSYRIVARVLLSKCCEGTLWTTHIYRLTTDMFLSV